jgi:hypothetical protein
VAKIEHDFSSSICPSDGRNFIDTGGSGCWPARLHDAKHRPASNRGFEVHTGVRQFPRLLGDPRCAEHRPPPHLAVAAEEGGLWHRAGRQMAFRLWPDFSPLKSGYEHFHGGSGGPLCLSLCEGDAFRDQLRPIVCLSPMCVAQIRLVLVVSNSG